MAVPTMLSDSTAQFLPPTNTVGRRLLILVEEIRLILQTDVQYAKKTISKVFFMSNETFSKFDICDTP